MGAPAKCEFLKNGMNVVDVLSILPFFIELFMTEDHVFRFVHQVIKLVKLSSRKLQNLHHFHHLG